MNLIAMMFCFFCLSKTFLPPTASRLLQFLSALNSYQQHPKSTIQQVYQILSVLGLGPDGDYISQTSTQLGYIIVFTSEM